LGITLKNAPFFGIEIPQRRHCAHAKGKVRKVGVLDADGSRTKVIGGGRKNAGGKNPFEGGVVGMQSIEGIFVIRLASN